MPGGKRPSSFVCPATNTAKAEEWSKYRELVIVPDGVLWYCRSSTSRAGRVWPRPAVDADCGAACARCCRSPCPADWGRKSLPRTAIVAGKLLPRDDDGSNAWGQQIHCRGGGRSCNLSQAAASVGHFAATISRLVVLADSDDSEKQPAGVVAPFVLDAEQEARLDAGRLAPATPGRRRSGRYCPASHTPAENGLKRGGSGDELS